MDTAVTTTTKQYSIPAYRISLVRDSKVATPARAIRSSSDAASVLRSYLGDTDREHFVAILLDTKNKIIGIHTVSTGSLSASVVHPRETFKAAILSNAAAMVVGHNHPSGDPQPSREDRALTERLVAGGKLLGIPILDHVIIGDGTMHSFSFADEGLINATA